MPSARVRQRLDEPPRVAVRSASRARHAPSAPAPTWAHRRPGLKRDARGSGARSRPEPGPLDVAERRRVLARQRPAGLGDEAAATLGESSGDPRRQHRALPAATSRLPDRAAEPEPAEPPPMRSAPVPTGMSPCQARKYRHPSRPTSAAAQAPAPPASRTPAPASRRTPPHAPPPPAGPPAPTRPPPTPASPGQTAPRRAGAAPARAPRGPRDRPLRRDLDRPGPTPACPNASIAASRSAAHDAAPIPQPTIRLKTRLPSSSGASSSAASPSRRCSTPKAARTGPDAAAQKSRAASRSLASSSATVNPPCRASRGAEPSTGPPDGHAPDDVASLYANVNFSPCADVGRPGMVRRAYRPRSARRR